MHRDLINGSLVSGAHEALLLLERFKIDFCMPGKKYNCHFTISTPNYTAVNISTISIDAKKNLVGWAGAWIDYNERSRVSNIAHGAGKRHTSPLYPYNSTLYVRIRTYICQFIARHFNTMINLCLSAELCAYSSSISVFSKVGQSQQPFRSLVGCAHLGGTQTPALRRAVSNRTTITVPCATFSANGRAAYEGRHTETPQDQCRTCGGTGQVPARPGESRETLWPDTVPGSEPAEEKIVRLTRERDEMAVQARACAEEVDRVREGNRRLRIALHDAIRRPLGVTPDSALEFYSPRMADEAEAQRLTPSVRTEGER